MRVVLTTGLFNPRSGKQFARQLLKWYDTEKRNLPWRGDRDPYRVWVSEIMLQQTRVAAVLDYYARFLKRFPNVQILASARETSVLAAWSGMGYYRRARMLHQASKIIARELNGVFPSTSIALRNLPGIGRYTAAAVASISFDEPIAAVDGNVERVLCRLIGGKLSGEPLWQQANGLLEARRPGDHNQAMMELGAMVCLPREPRCGACPVSSFCLSQGKEITASSRPSPRKVVANYAFCFDGEAIFLRQRTRETPLMPNMWELPEMVHVGTGEPLLRLRHSITNTNYEVKVWLEATPQKSEVAIPKARLTHLPLTGLTRKILSKAGVI